MTFDSSVPIIEIEDTGPVAPEPEDILDGVFQDLNASLGGDLNIDQLTTPQGQLAQSQAAVTVDKNNAMIELMKNMNPDTSSGVMQDAIGRIYLMERISAQSTVVTCTCTGTAGTIIPAFSKVQSSSNTIFVSSSAGTIGTGGTVDIIFSSETTGAIEATIGSVNKIYQQIAGWDTVTNAIAGTVGRDVESRAEFEYRRVNSVALNATGSLPAIRANVLAIDDVIDVRTEENTTNADLVVGGVTLTAHSLYVAVIGGDDDEIAKAIWTRKAAGCAYNGATSVIVQDTENYSSPYPEYTVLFQRPTDTRIVFSVEIADISSTPTNYEELVQDAIYDAFNGLDGSLRARIGNTIYALNYLTSVQDAGPLTVLTLEVSIFGGTLAELAELDIDEYPTLDKTDITVALV